MAEFSGSALVCSWVYAGGTVTLTGDHRTASLNPGIDLKDASAGSDASKTQIKTLKSWNIQVGAVAQSGGTALEDALVEGTYGTITLQPEGTATGKRKYTGAAFAMGPQFNWPYDDVCEYSVTFDGDGDLTRTTN